MARFMSYGPSAALAGSVQGGLLPEPTFSPPRKTGWNLCRGLVREGWRGDGREGKGEFGGAACLLYFYAILF